MAGEGSSNIGDVVATLRADLRDFVNNVQAASKNLDTLSKSSAGTQQAVALVSKAIDNWTIKLALGKITTEEFAQKIQLLQTSFQGVLSGADAAEKATTGLGNAMSSGYRPVTRMTFGMVTLAREALGVQRGFAQAAEGALLFSGLPITAVLGLSAAIALVAGAYDALTKAQREHNKENEKLIAALRQEADRDIPDDVRALKQATAANEELTKALQHRIDTLKKMPPGLRGIAGGVEDQAVAKAQSDQDLGIQRVTQANFDKLIDRAKTLQDALKAGLADPAMRKEADLLAESLVQMGLDADQTNPKLAQLGIEAKNAGDALFNTLYPAQEKVRKSNEDYFKELGELVKLGAISVSTSNEMADAIDTLTAKINSGHESRQQMIKDLRDLDALVKESGLGQLQLAPVQENLGPFLKPKLPGNATVEITTKVSDSMKEMQRIVARGVDDIIKTFVEGILGGGKSIGKALIDVFRRAIAQLIASLIEQKIIDKIYRALGLTGGGSMILGGGGAASSGSSIGSAIGTGIAMAGLLFNRQSAPVTVPISQIAPPPVPSPAIAARDTYWRSVFVETARYANLRLA